MLSIANPDLDLGVGAVRYDRLPAELEPALAALAAEVSRLAGGVIDLTAVGGEVDRHPAVVLRCWIAGHATVEVAASAADLPEALARARVELLAEVRSSTRCPT
jgi:hypothetical protein